MHYYELVISEKAKYRQPVLMYHGTTSLYLRSILTQGVVPDPKQKTWGQDPAASFAQINRSSLFGSYWTSNFMTAESSAFTSARKFGGHVLIVMAMLAEGSAFADEDSLNLRWPWAALMRDIGVVEDAISIPAYAYYARNHSDDPEIRAYQNKKLDRQREKMIHDFAAHLHTGAKASEQQPLDIGLAQAAFEAYLVRQLAFSGQDYYSPLRDVDEEDRPTLPSPAQADANLQQIQDKLTRRYRASAYKNQGNYMHTLRMPTPIGYAGGNKIICIVEEGTRKSTEATRPVKLWYGQVPGDYLAQYRERVGPFPGLIEGKTGEALLPPDPRKQDI